jgi:regulator of sirC expression with transglutaminase-like and TPR domain
MLNNNRSDLLDFLTEQGQRPADQIDLFQTALALSGLRHPNRSLERYDHQINRLTQETGDILSAQGAASEVDSEAQLAALEQVFVQNHNYHGNAEHYELIDNADICYVMDNATGLPVALSILYLEVCERLNIPAEGINFPGHFLIRLTASGSHILFDPFNLARKAGAPELRQIIKHVKGPDAELSQDYYQAANKQEILVRLQNNIKKRQIAAEDYKAALDTVLATEKIAPSEYRLLLDKGVLLAKNTMGHEAIETLEKSMSLAPYPEDRADALMFIEQIHRDLL